MGGSEHETISMRAKLARPTLPAKWWSWVFLCHLLRLVGCYTLINLHGGLKCRRVVNFLRRCSERHTTTFHARCFAQNCVLKCFCMQISAASAVQSMLWCEWHLL